MTEADRVGCLTCIVPCKLTKYYGIPLTSDLDVFETRYDWLYSNARSFIWIFIPVLRYIGEVYIILYD